jgi:hypothetical protein
MRLRYETGTATLIQFGVVTLLGLMTQVIGIVKSCLEDSSQCVGDSMLSLVFVILMAAWLGIVSVIGYAAQDKRSRKIATVLIGCEVLILGVASFNAQHSTVLFDKLTSVVDAAIAIWIIVLAFRLVRAGSSRIVARQRTAPTVPRRRPTPLDR